MDQKVQCPVCTLYLHEGMALAVHLDTHPKDQVIMALCALSNSKPPQLNSNSNSSSRPSSRSSRPSSRAASTYSNRSRSRSPCCRIPGGCRCHTPRPSSQQTPAPVSIHPPLVTLPPPPTLLQKPPLVSTPYMNSIPDHHGIHRVGQTSMPVRFVVPSPHPFDDPTKKNILIASLPVSSQTTQPKRLLNPVYDKFQQTMPFGPSGNTPIIYQKIDSSKYLATGDGSDPMSRPIATFPNMMVLQSYPKTACLIRQQQPPTATGLVNGNGGSLFRPAMNALQLHGFNSNGAERVLSIDGGTSAVLEPMRCYSKPPPPQVLQPFDDKIVNASPKKYSSSESNSRLSSLKILSDVKIEPNTFANSPLLHDVIDLTLRTEIQRKRIKLDLKPNLNAEESILPDLEETVSNSFSQGRFCNEYSSNYTSPATMPENDPSFNDASVASSLSNSNALSNSCANTFSVIKNIGNPNSFKPVLSTFSTVESPQISGKDLVPNVTCVEKSHANFLEETAKSSYAKANLQISINESFKNNSMLDDDVSSPATLIKMPAKRNVYSKKPKKNQPIKNLKEKKIDQLEQIDKPSSSSMSTTLTEKNTEIKNSVLTTFNFHTEEFVKDLNKAKNDESKSSQSPKHFLSQVECKSIENSNMCTSNSDVVLSKCPIFTDQSAEHSVSSEVILENNLNNVFSNGRDDKECFLNIDKQTEIVENKTSELESVRPVNVIAFGSMVMPNNNITSSDSLTNFSDISKINTSTSNEIKAENNKQILSMIDNTYINENSYSASFSHEKSNDTSESVDNIPKVHKVEPSSVEDIPNRNDQYIWNDSTQKEEFVFANFMQFNQNLYQKIENCPEDREQMNVVNKDYTELLCPRDNYLEQDEKSSFFNSLGKENCSINDADVLNIRTDERMPPRGELSEQESSGDMDAPWAGMYRDSATFSDVVGSTSYDLLTRETWPSDGSDIDIPPSPARSTYKENDNDNAPIVVSMKPPDKNYKCATCGKAFNCPKERRVHRSKEHPTTVSSDKKILKQKSFTPIKTKIKKESPIKTESITPSSTSNSTAMDIEIIADDSKKVDIKPLETEFIECKNIDTIDDKPQFDMLKVGIERKKTDFTCSTCKEEFQNSFLFNEHLKIHPLECLTCGKLFNRRPNLQLHLKRHFGIKDYKCNICGKRFITKQKMIEHYNIHTGKTPIKCNLCDLFFRRHSNMVQHRNRHHLKVKKKLRDYVCFCGEVFHTKKKLAWHKEIHDDKPKACLHCNEKFIHMSSLTRHIRRTHNNSFVPDEKRKNENVECPECNNIYLKSSIEMHMKTHTGSKPFSCVICNKSFTTKWNLKLHKWIHANRSSKPFKCSLCKGAFIRQADYVSHMNAHKSVRPYTCNYCGCQFIRKYNCQRHVKEHENEKKYVCEVPDCGKTFHRSYYLTEHLTVHSGVRPFSCNICGKTSSTKSNHNKHVKIHHAREPVTTES